MKKLLVALSVVFATIVAVAAVPPSTVAELTRLVQGLIAAHKSDTEIAIKLQEIHLSEQLTPKVLKGLLDEHPGPRTTEQIILLLLDSSQLAPPATDVPKDPAPTAAEQAELLKKAVMIVTETFPKIPKLTADKKSVRFQNGVSYIKNTSGNGGSMSNANGYSEIAEPVYLSLINQETLHINTQAGVEDAPGYVKQKDPGGQLGQISQTVPGLSLLAVLGDLGKSTPTWLRWQTINDRQIAVFAFSIPRKQSSYKVNYCCFPELEHIGSGMQFSGNSGTATSFVPFKTATGYHGELFVDAKTGLILRLITKADPKVTDFVHQEDIRIDYEPLMVGGTPYVLPTHSTILSTVVPNGDSYVKFSARRTLFDINYSNYKP